MTNYNILDWEESVQLDETIEEYEYRRYPPNAGGVAMLNNPGEIRFSIESGDIFTHPHRSYLQFEGRLVKNDGTGYGNDDVIALVNNAMLYLFSQIRYEIGGREIETLLYPGQATTMLGLLEYSDDFSISKGLNQGWFKDSDTIPYNAIHQARAVLDDNRGFKARHDQLFNSVGGADNKGKFTFNVPLSHIFGFCKDYDKVLYGVKQELILTRKTDSEPYYKTEAQAVGGGGDVLVDGRIEIKNLYWFVPQIKPSIGNLNTMMEAMRKNIQVKLGFNKRQVFSVGLPADNTSYTWALTTKAATEKPRFLVLAFQNNNVKDDQKLNASVFKHLNISELHVFLNNTRRYPALDFEMNFTSNHYSDAYDATSNYKCLVEGIPGCVSNCNINPIDYKGLYPLFVIDISKQSSALKTSIINITVEMKFRNGIPAGSNAYGVLLSDQVFSLQADGKELKPVY